MNGRGIRTPASRGLPAPEFRRVFEATSVPYLVVAPDFTIVAANDAYLTATLRRREEILGRNVFDVFPDNPEDPETRCVAALKASLQRVLDTRAADTMPVQKYDIQRPPERGGGFEPRYWSPVNSPVVDEDGNVAYVIHRVEDVTDFVRMKEQLAEGGHDAEAMSKRLHDLEAEMFHRSRERFEANLRLREANEAMAALDQAKTTFVNNVNHELRTPLTLILGPIEDLLHSARGIDARQREELVLAHRNALRLLKLVNALLEFARIEAGRVAVTYEPTDLASFTSELASVFRSTVEYAGLRLLVDCPPLPEMVFVDRSMWEKIVLNLISNAFKFTLQGEIEVSLRAQGGQAELRVRDTGAGIPAHELPHIFERFRRVKGTQGRTQEGAGIGLALVQELVRLHGGAIRVDSRLGEGSTFTVTVPGGRAHLPAEHVTDTQTRPTAPSGAGLYAEEALSWLPQQNAATPELAPGPVQQRQRIVLADDNADMRGYICRLLGEHYDVEAVADGDAALAAIRAHRPDLVLTDVIMLGMNGVDLVRALRQDSRTTTLPVIILSASAAEDARIEGIQAGADDYLVKPFSARELLARVAGQLAQSENARRVQALRAQAEAMRAHLEMVLESVSDAFVAIDRNWRITFVNSKAAQECGKPKERLIGQDPRRIYAIDPASPILGMFDDAMSERKARHMEYRHDPTGRWWEVRAFPSPEGLVIFSTDITERKRSEERLQEAQERLRTAAEIARLGFCEWSLDTDQIRFSREWKKQLGYGAVELPDRLDEWTSRLHPEDRDGVLEAIARIRTAATSEHEMEYRLRHRDGTYRWIGARFRPRVNERGVLDRLVVTHLDVTEQKDAEQRTRLIAQHDPLTGIPNRALLCELAHHMIAGARRSGGKLAVFFFDLDRFKPINDTYGHPVGDRVLKEVARRLAQSLRTQDLVGRFGGDELVAVVQIHDERDAARIAKHARDLVAQPYAVEGLSLTLGVSIGISLFPRDGEVIEVLIQRADAAMYQVKESGRNNYQFFTAELDRQARAVLDTESRMRRALHQREFSIFYQAVLNPKTGAVTGVEALLRWPQPDRTFIDPLTFIPIAENTGLIQPLGEWVFAEVARQHREWQDAGLPALQIAVNISPLQLRHTAFLASVERFLSESDMAPQRLTLEVPESALASDPGDSLRVIQALKDLGIQIALDDLGIGPSSLSGLSRLPFDKLKLDHSFVQRLPNDRSIPALVDMILAMGRSLHMEVIAEGIETEEALEFIRARDCDRVQGFYLCPPMPGREFATWYHQRAA